MAKPLGMSGGDLTDKQWARLEPHVPRRKTKVGRPAADYRQVVSGILWVLRTGAPWRDLPERYGPPGSVSSCFYRWRTAGVWERMLAALQQEAEAAGEIDWNLHDVDGTTVRAHQHAAGAKKRHARQTTTKP